MNKTLALASATAATAAELARLAFATQPSGFATATLGPRHLAFLPPEALALDLSDPAQREFGDYELLEKIGQGGMGVVYRARQKALQREVALKLLAAGPWASVDFIERFQREAQSAARMEHPNIVTVFETGSHEDLHYFSMRLVRGQSLAARLRESGPFKPNEAARLMRTVAEAVDYAHRLHVLHLDLKPGNILIDENGEPLVADFGLARRLDQALADHGDEVSGTPSYMAPEQAHARSQRIGTCTDIYGLGAIFYELLTGEPPFLGATPQETLNHVVLENPIPPRKRNPGIPADLEAICLKCLSKEPEQRYSRARHLADDLNRFLEGRPVSARPLNAPQRVLRFARRDPRLTGLVALLFFSLVIGIGVSSVQWRRAESNAETSRSLLWDSRRDTALRLEQDGKGFEALPKLLANLDEQEHVGKPVDAALDRRRIGLLVGQGATLIDRITVADANPMATQISPDGSLLALSFNDLSVRWYDTATLTERGRVSLADLTSSSGQRAPILLLRFVGEHRLRATFAWFTNFANPDDCDTWLIDLDHAKLVAPPAAFADFADANYSANGQYALLRNRQRRTQLWQVPQLPSTQWRPLSALAAAQADFQPWLLDPRGRFAISLGLGLRQLTFYDLPDLATAHVVNLPGNAGVAAWTLSGDGKTLALGDFEGRIFLLDTATRALRTLPTTRGREITWIAFSEDDAWLATASFDGTVHAFDVASGDSLVAGEMGHDYALQQVGLSHSKRLLIATGAGQTALWRLTLPGPRAVPAQRIGLGPAPHGLVGGPYPIGWSLDTGLLASAGLDGQIRLWRLPVSPMQSARASRQFSDAGFFDGSKLVDVEWNKLRIVATTGVALTPWLELPQPPGYAELLDGGRLLVLTTGPQLRIYDAANLQLRFPPIALDNSPQRLLANADGSRVLLSFGGSGPDGFLERLQLYNARTGERLPGEAVLRGQLRHLAFSADSTRILAVGPADAATTILASTGLHRIGEYPHDSDEPVKWADFASDRSGAASNDVVLVTSASDARLGNDSLLTWHPDDDQIRSKQSTGQTRPIGVIATATGAFVAGSNQDTLIPGTGDAHVIERLARSEPTAVLALSPDRRVLARAFQREIQLYDVATSTVIGPPLQSDSNAMDSVVQLMFSPDGRQLLARTVQGHWLLWPIAAEARSTKDLGASVMRLSVGNESQQTLVMPSAGERAALRVRDPGRWRTDENRPTPSPALRTLPGLIIPARAPDTTPLLLDLGAIYDFAPDEIRNTFYNIVPQMRPLPAGVQRIAGVDYDLRGMVQVGSLNRFGAEDSSIQIRCLPLPPEPVAALHMLFTVSLPTPMPTGQAVANMTLHYRDGGSAVLPLRAGQELRGFAGNDLGVPLAYAPNFVTTLFGYEDMVYTAPRLPNPEPQRPIRCLDLRVTQLDHPMLLLGITVEPVASAPTLAAPVTDAPILRITNQPGH